MWLLSEAAILEIVLGVQDLLLEPILHSVNGHKRHCSSALTAKLSEKGSNIY